MPDTHEIEAAIALLKGLGYTVHAPKFTSETIQLKSRTDISAKEQAVATLRSQGMTLRQIAKRLGISAEGARYAEVRYYRKQAADSDILDELPSRLLSELRHLFGRQDISASEIAARIGSILKYSPPGFGNASKRTLREWAERHHLFRAAE